MKSNMEKVLIVLGAILLFFAILIPICALTALITMWAWNIFVPAIFHLGTITFWQAWAVNILAGLFMRVVGTSK